MVDRQCRESEGKAKIEGYVSVSDEAHQQAAVRLNLHSRYQMEMPGETSEMKHPKSQGQRQRLGPRKCVS